MVLNLSEMEVKVREATNDEPWCVVHDRNDTDQIKLSLGKGCELNVDERNCSRNIQLVRLSFRLYAE